MNLMFACVLVAIFFLVLLTIRLNVLVQLYTTTDYQILLERGGLSREEQVNGKCKVDISMSVGCNYQHRLHNLGFFIPYKEKDTMTKSPYQ